MADYYIENDQLKVGVNAFGAELRSIVRKSDGREYMWSGDSKYWGKTSPILFPFVGALKDGKYIYDGKEYAGIPKHGFAREYDHVVASHEADKIWFEFTGNEKTKEIYPFDFKLRLGYALEGNKLHVMWGVDNNDSKDMYFSIGGHPAFACGEDNDEKDPKIGYRVNLNVPKDNFTLQRADLKTGTIYDTEDISAPGGVVTMTEGCYDKDALIFDTKDIHTISLETPDGKPFIAVHFDMPLVGVWSPVGNAPFVCIEPWCGRCDASTFEGTLEEREYGNLIPAGHSFNKEYVVEIL